MKSIRKQWLCVILICLVLAGLLMALRGRKETYTRRQFVYWDCLDTECTFILYLPDTQDKDQWNRDIHEELLRYHQLMDAYNGYEGVNNVYTINQNAGVQPVEVDPVLFELIQFCLEEGEKIGYRTNIGFGQVTRIWKEVINTGVLPEADQLEEAGRHVDPSGILLDEENRTVYLEDPEMILDVGAVAKGYVADRMAEYLADRGIDAACISLGGNLKAIGEKKTDAEIKNWLAQLDNPEKSDSDSSETYSFILLLPDGMSMVTSGNYRRYRMIEGERYHHLIDPDTLYPAQEMASVTILTENSLLADYLSTALFTVDVERGMEILALYEDVEAFWVTSDYQIYYTEGFADYIVQEDTEAS